MNFSTRVLLSASAFFFAGVFQTLGAPSALSDDPAYQYFVMQIRIEQQQTEYKLAVAQSILFSNLQTLNLLEFDSIKSNLTTCFEDINTKYKNVTDDYCMQSVEMDVEQTISDSENELAACGNMTHSMELVQPLVEQAVEAIKSLNDTVDQMISSGSACMRYSKNPNQELKCLNSITSKYSKQWDSVTSLVQEAYYKVSGLDLLLNAETSGCKTAENFSLAGKCDAILSEVLSNCLTSTTTTTTPTA